MKKRLVKIARVLRKNSTDQESKLWYNIKNKNFANLKFRRQYPIGDYVVDFCCPAKKLVLELDGSGHLLANQRVKDEIRDKFLVEQGFQVIRINNSDINGNLDGVLESIFNLLDRD